MFEAFDLLLKYHFLLYSERERERERESLSFEQSELDSKYSLNSLHVTWSVVVCCCMRYCVLLYVCSLCGVMCFGWAWVVLIGQNLVCWCMFKCCGGKQ